MDRVDSKTLDLLTLLPWSSEPVGGDTVFRKARDDAGKSYAMDYQRDG